MNANSGRPYNITTGLDDNGDTVTNDRPAGVKRNSGNGPGSFGMNLNLTKTINLKSAGKAPSTAGANVPNTFAEPQRGGFPGGGQGRPGGPGGAGGPGPRPGGPGGGPGGGRGPFGQGFGQPRIPTMAFQINIQNLFNNLQLGQYSGVMTSPFFGRANSARNPRQIELGLRFNF